MIIKNILAKKNVINTIPTTMCCICLESFDIQKLNQVVCDQNTTMYECSGCRGRRIEEGLGCVVCRRVDHNVVVIVREKKYKIKEILSALLCLGIYCVVSSSIGYFLIPEEDRQKYSFLNFDNFLVGSFITCIIICVIGEYCVH